MIEVTRGRSSAPVVNLAFLFRPTRGGSRLSERAFDYRATPANPTRSSVRVDSGNRAHAHAREIVALFPRAIVDIYIYIRSRRARNSLRANVNNSGSGRMNFRASVGVRYTDDEERKDRASRNRESVSGGERMAVRKSARSVTLSKVNSRFVDNM